MCVSGVTALLVQNQGCGRGGRVSPPWENKEGDREIAEREENASFCDREVEDLMRDPRTGGKDLYNRLL